MNEVLCGIGAAATTFAVSEANGSDLWISVITSIVSALVFALINILTKVITSTMEKKGLISAEHKKAIDETADDLADDGKINGSNKEPKVDDTEEDEVN